MTGLSFTSDGIKSRISYIEEEKFVVEYYEDLDEAIEVYDRYLEERWKR